jgi:cysteine desulfurase
VPICRSDLHRIRVGSGQRGNPWRRKRILLGAADHHCVLHTADNLRKLGYQVDLVPSLKDSAPDLDQLENLLKDDVLLLSLMHANNETGRIYPVEKIVQMCAKWDVVYHCDAVQTFLKDDLPDPVKLGADLVSVAAHKINGPKGVGGLYIKGGTKIKPLVAGGGQERELRAGTENVVAIAGFGEAIRSNKPHDVGPLRDAFVARLQDAGALPTLPSLAQGECLTGHAHVRFPGIDAETLLIRFDQAGLSSSSGSACSSGSVEPSHVLLACGYSEEEAKEGLRFTFGLGNTPTEAHLGADVVVEAVEAVRNRRQSR